VDRKTNFVQKAVFGVRTLYEPKLWLEEPKIEKFCVRILVMFFSDVIMIVVPLRKTHPSSELSA